MGWTKNSRNDPAKIVSVKRNRAAAFNSPAIGHSPLGQCC
jgi:hypothetical protein